MNCMKKEPLVNWQPDVLVTISVGLLLVDAGELQVSAVLKPLPVMVT
jgi:hypothetical protein